MPRGGKREGAGLPEGFKYPATLSKEAAREALRTIVLREMDALVAAQVANAKGLQHFFLRDPKTGQFQKIEDAALIEAALNSGEKDSYYWIFTKDPSIQAFSDLMNRSLDKPKDQEQEITLKGDTPLIEALLAGRARAKNR